jgi:chaperonin cofactor prefoldin
MSVQDLYAGVVALVRREVHRLFSCVVQSEKTEQLERKVEELDEKMEKLEQQMKIMSKEYHVLQKNFETVVLEKCEMEMYIQDMPKGGDKFVFPSPSTLRELNIAPNNNKKTSIPYAYAIPTNVAIPVHGNLCHFGDECPRPPRIRPPCPNPPRPLIPEECPTPYPIRPPPSCTPLGYHS